MKIALAIEPFCFAPVVDVWLYKSTPETLSVAARSQLRIDGFDLVAGNRSKCRKHGVPLAAIEDVFRHPLAVFPDPAHSDFEQRFIAIGRSIEKRRIILVFTQRN